MSRKLWPEKVEIRCCYTIYYLLSLSMCAKKEVKKGIPEWQQDFHVITHCATVMFKTEKLMFENSLIFELVVANLC